MVQADFLLKLSEVENEEDARLLLGIVYPTSVKSTDDFYTTSGIEDLGWDSFYAVRELEDKFGLGNFASSYIATSLAYPKISKMYASIAANCGQDKGDFCSKVLENISTTAIASRGFSISSAKKFPDSAGNSGPNISSGASEVFSFSY